MSVSGTLPRLSCGGSSALISSMTSKCILMLLVNFLNMLVGNVGRSLEKEGVKARGEAPVFIETVPDSGKHLKFVVTNLLLDGEEPRAVAPSASGILYLSNAE